MITQQLLQGISAEVLYEEIKMIPIQQLVHTIENADKQLKNQLSDASKTIHESMRSHHSMGTAKEVQLYFKNVEKYLKILVKDHLSWWQRQKISIQHYFVDHDEEGSKLKIIIESLKTCHKNIMQYDAMITLKSKDFFDSLGRYQLWTSTLNKFISELLEIHGAAHTQEFYDLSLLVGRNMEFLAAQRQLETTISLQQQNNRVITTDILHVIAISQSLSQNIISAQQFFTEQYVGSMKRIHSYTKR